MKKLIEKNFEIISENFLKLKSLSSKIERIAQICINAERSGHKIMFCGNGGSAADAQHLAAELVGKYKIDRKSYNAVALTTNTSILTAIGNDIGYETVFERQLEGLGQKEDVLIVLSTSGNSENIIRAIKKAKTMGITTIAFTGENANKASELADYSLNVPSSTTNNIQEMHIATGHVICELIEIELSKSNNCF